MHRLWYITMIIIIYYHYNSENESTLRCPISAERRKMYFSNIILSLLLYSFHLTFPARPGTWFSQSATVCNIYWWVVGVAGGGWSGQGIFISLLLNNNIIWYVSRVRRRRRLLYRRLHLDQVPRGVTRLDDHRVQRPDGQVDGERGRQQSGPRRMAGAESQHGRERPQEADGYLGAGTVSPLYGGRMFACEGGRRNQKQKQTKNSFLFLNIRSRDGDSVIILWYRGGYIIVSGQTSGRH